MRVSGKMSVLSIPQLINGDRGLSAITVYQDCLYRMIFYRVGITIKSVHCVATQPSRSGLAIPVVRYSSAFLIRGLALAGCQPATTR